MLRLIKYNEMVYLPVKAGKKTGSEDIKQIVKIFDLSASLVD